MSRQKKASRAKQVLQLLILLKGLSGSPNKIVSLKRLRHGVELNSNGRVAESLFPSLETTFEI
jgi:hypothetical protein